MIICQTRRNRVLGFRLADVIVHLECPGFYIGGLGNRYLALYVSLAVCRLVTVVGFGYSGVILAEDFSCLWRVWCAGWVHSSRSLRELFDFAAFGLMFVVGFY